MAVPEQQQINFPAAPLSGSTMLDEIISMLKSIVTLREGGGPPSDIQEGEYFADNATAPYIDIYRHMSDGSNMALFRINKNTKKLTLMNMTNLPIADGGTGASDAATALSNLGADTKYLYRANNLSDVADLAATRDRVGGVPPGTKMLFKQNAAPAGWTFVAEDNDRALINSSTEADGGQIGGSWTISGLSGSVAGHALTISEMPSHDHKLKAGDYATYFNDAVAFHDEGQTWSPNQNYGPSTKSAIQTAGGNGSHSHGFTPSHDGSWRPSYAKVITCKKD